MAKKILLCVSGTTPQIITETLYALCFIKTPPFIPDEVHVITTSIGKKFIEKKLLDPISGKFYSFIQEYNIPAPIFNSNTIHVIKDKDSYIQDIITEEHNKITGNFILNIVKNLCLPEDNYIHASIAGGRKTMSLFLGMAMQFYAKYSDEMYHVLINPPFESHPDFYYPPKYPEDIIIFDTDENNYKFISTEKAKIYLAVIPFIKLRYTNINLNRYKDFINHINMAQKNLNCPIPILKLNKKEISIYINDREICFTPMEKSIYYYFLNKKRRCNLHKCNIDCINCYVSILDIDIYDICKIYKKLMGNFSSRVNSFEEKIKQINILDWFLQHRARINKKITKIDATGLCKIKSIGKYGNKCYGISLPKERILVK